MDPTSEETEPLLQKDNKKTTISTNIAAITCIVLSTPIYVHLAYVSITDQRTFVFVILYYLFLVPAMLSWAKALTHERDDMAKARKWGQASGILFSIQLIILPIVFSEWWKKTGWEAVSFWVMIGVGFAFVVLMHAVYFEEHDMLVKDEDGSVHDLLPPEKMV